MDSPEKRHQESDTSPQRSPTNYHLPTELLIRIFKILYDLFGDDNGEKQFLCIILEDNYSSRERDETLRKIIALSRFPYTFSTVCPRWHDILGTMPYFWDMIVIDVGQNATPLADVRDYFQWSADLSIQVIIHRSDGYDIDDTLEESRVRSVTELLAPHLHRCTVLVYRVTHASSLPILGSELHGSTQKMTGLYLISQRDNLLRSKERIPGGRDKMDYFTVKSLQLDGHNFYDAFTTGHGRPLPRSQNLSISHYANDLAAQKPMSLRDTINILRELRPSCLSLSNLTFNADPPPDGKTFASFLELAEFDVDMLALLLPIINALHSIVITRCSLVGFRSSTDVRWPYRLILDKVDLHNIGPFLRSCQSSWIELRRCTSVDEEFFEEMARGDDFMCPRLTYLVVEKCSPPFSKRVGRLIRRMVKARVDAVRRCWKRAPPDAKEKDLEICRLAHIDLVGEGMTISREDEERMGWRWTHQSC